MGIRQVKGESANWSGDSGLAREVFSSQGE